jgi:threonine/homoserine/homoserine lactone efflux protein
MHGTDKRRAWADLGPQTTDAIVSDARAVGRSPSEPTWSRADERPEPPRQVRLVGEADFGRHVRQRLTAEDPLARRLQAPAEDIGVRRDPERRRERTGNLGRPGADRSGGRGDRDRLEQVRVEMGAQALGEIRPDDRSIVGGRLAEHMADPLGHERQTRLGLEEVVRAGERVVNCGHGVPERGIGQDGTIDRTADQVLAEQARLEVEHPFPEPRARRSPAIVDDVRRKHRHPGPTGGPGPTVELVDDCPVVDDEDRPDVVRVRRVGVRRERRVEDLPDPGDRRLPGADHARSGRGDHRRIVQDAPLAAPYGRRVDAFVGLVGFAFVSSVTPGPNNVLLWASGAQFGLTRTVPHIIGTAVGIGLMALAIAVGLGGLLSSVPALALAMKVAGSAYLLYLAYRIAAAHGLVQTEAARPLGLVQAVAFQVINPKAWFFALGAMTTFRPTELPVVAGSVLVAVTMVVVILPTAALWAVAGGSINRLLTSDRRRRVVSLLLAGLVVATVLTVWL